jgi:hypothetical protein
MLVCPLFSALHLYPSDMEQTHVGPYHLRIPDLGPPRGSC